MAYDRDVGGIRCMEVLDALPSYLEGELGKVARQRVDRHLAGCDWCERFGGRYAAAVTLLRRERATPPQPPPERTRQLWRRLDGADLIDH
jgi:predicted anti-sigma-YlaC factor YlaD